MSVEQLGFLLGSVGGFCMAICAVPQCIDAYRSGVVVGISYGFLLLWLLGEVCLLGYNYLELGMDPFLLLNYGINIVCIVYLLVKKIDF